MPFRITEKMNVKKDAEGVTRQINHPRQPYTSQSMSAARALAAPPSRRQLADEYLREVMPAFGQDAAAMMSDLNRALAAQPESGEGEQLRFEKEKAVGRQATVSYAQTYAGIPVWEAGVTVRMRGDNRITGSTNSMHYGIQLDPPPEGAAYLPDKIDEAVLGRLLGVDPAAAKLRINDKPLLVYQYDDQNRGACGPHGDHTDESQMHVSHPTLTPPPVPDSIRSGRHYVVVNALFTLNNPTWGDLNWSAFIEPETGAVLFIRCFVGCMDGFVFERDPLTATGNTSIRPSSSTAVLNAVRNRVTLEGLAPVAPQEQVALRGEFVRVVNVAQPNVAAPTEDPADNFLYDVPTDDFSAVNAYYHCDRLFRILQGMGFDVQSYFDGTTFPVSVDHRVAFDGNPNAVNASAPGNRAGNGSDGFRFALVQSNTNVGMAVEWRVILHEFGHSILWDNVNSPNFRFAHSAGDTLGAILNDAESSAPDPGRTFPWTIITRRHDRNVGAGWAWGGSRDSRFPVGHPSSRDVAGYDREQILSSTLFRLYQAIGGSDANVATRRAAARYVVYLIFDSIASLTRFSQPQDAEDYAEVLIESDIGTDDFEGQPGGLIAKIIRWSFEQQGAYQPANAPRPVRTPGAPPNIDLFIDDGRGGEYTPANQFVADTTDVWSRQSADGGTGHQAPIQGRSNFIYARVGNRGAGTAQNCTLRLFAAENPIAPVWPNDWTSIGSATVTSIAGNDEEIVGPIEWVPANAGETGLLVSITNDADRSNLEFVGGPVSTAKLAHCDNNIVMRQLTVQPGAPPVEPDSNTVVSRPDLAIPDDDDAGVSNDLAFSKSGTIAGLEVAVDIKHTFIGDLRLQLISPAGTAVVLHNKSGGSAHDLIMSYSSDTNTALATLLGEQSEGAWRLHIADTAGQDTGTLREWSLTFDLDDAPTAVNRTSTPNADIPDVSSAGVSDVIAVNATGELRSIAVPVNVRHTYIGDLVIALTSPSGKTVTLHDRDGGSSHDIDTVYTRDNASQLAALEGESVQGDWSLRVSDMAFDDVGVLVNWGLQLALGPSTPTTVLRESSPGRAIPDEDASGIADTLTVTQDGTIAGVRVQVEIVHTFIGDLRVVLTSPAGTDVVLHNESGGSTQNLSETYSSEDSTRLASLHDESGGGEWKLSVADLVGQDTGTLVRWSVELTYST